MKLCKLSLYMLLSLLTVTVLGGIWEISPYIQGVLCLIVIYTSIYDGTFAGTVTGAFTGLSTGAFSPDLCMYMLAYAGIGFAFGWAGDLFIKKHYVNIVICAAVLGIVQTGIAKVDITQIVKNAYFSLAATVCGSLILYLPLRLIGKTGWKKNANS